MHMSILLAFLISATAAAPGSTSSPQPEPLKFSVGAMSFSGDSIKLTKTEGKTFECEIDGHATWTMGHDGDADIALAATKMIISRDANSEITIRCTGDCKLTDSDHTCTADRMQIQFAEQFEMKMFGSVRVAYGDGDSRTTLTGESVTVQDGAFHVSGAASLKRGS